PNRQSSACSPPDRSAFSKAATPAGAPTRLKSPVYAPFHAIPCRRSRPAALLPDRAAAGSAWRLDAVPRVGPSRRPREQPARSISRARRGARRVRARARCAAEARVSRDVQSGTRRSSTLIFRFSLKREKVPKADEGSSCEGEPACPHPLLSRLREGEKQ